MKRETQFLLRLTDEEKRSFEEAAKLAGLNTSAWARQKLRLAAARELRDADLQIPFLEGAQSA